MHSGLEYNPLTGNAASDLWRRTLQQIPSLFGRLVYLSSLRDPNSGEYAHHGLAVKFGAEGAAAALRESHEAAFADWLQLGLEGQKRELDLYVDTLEPGRKRIVESWTTLEPYRTLPPASARTLERDLFFSDLEMQLTLLRNEFGVSSID
ncbi:MAG: hypothetical protein HYZ37_10605 [Candidatus Solibacter usitatus]|nr:hypothetical protein [Candidatus Solibacter usitatus]